MSNIIRSNASSPNSEWLVISNQGTDCLLDLLISASETLEKTEKQEEFVSFLKDRKLINDIAPGTAGFDINEMPWQIETLDDDAGFLIRAAETAESSRIFKKLPYEVNREIVVPWLKQFALLVRQMIDETR